jgi:DNA primase
MSSSAIAAFAKQTYRINPVTRTVVLPVNSGMINEKERTQLDAWLMMYGITDAEYARYGMYWGAGRLVIPIHDGTGKPIYWQGRSFRDGEAKWVNQKQAGRSGIIFRTQAEPTTDGVVLVEDIISAIKVGRVMDAISLLGSYIPDDLILELAKHYRTIHIWLDADKAQYSLKRTLRYRAFDLPVKRIYSPKDPKAYTEEQILEFIEGGE